MDMDELIRRQTERLSRREEPKPLVAPAPPAPTPISSYTPERMDGLSDSIEEVFRNSPHAEDVVISASAAKMVQVALRVAAFVGRTAKRIPSCPECRGGVGSPDPFCKNVFHQKEAVTP